ncbi:Hypothetical protein A7982_01809 [Minicystis rosea]|nr:Hypothetical protein A7982_01809 [Minicystis rosea]
MLTMLAALVYGGWAFAVNLQHGAAPAVRAGCLQGASSATTTLVVSGAVERLYAARAGRPLQRIVAWLVPALLGACLHLTIHVIAGTPEILITILPSVVLGVVFAGTYVLGLMRAAPKGAVGGTTS